MPRRPNPRKSNNPSTRLFIALDISSELKSDLARLIAGFKDSGAGVRWVRPENLHLTLKFLGSVEEARLGGIRGALKAVAAQSAPFGFRCGGLGAFPDIRKPQVLWAGILGDQGNLVRLAQRTDEALAALGFPKAKDPFSPHLTFGRIGSPKGLRGLMEVYGLAAFTPSGTVSADKVVLYKSVTGSGGPVYEALDTFPLNG